MTITVNALERNSFVPSLANYGFGEVANNLQEIFRKVYKDINLTSFTYSENHFRLTRSLNEECKRSLEDIWDGEESRSFNFWSYLNSLKFIKLLPTSFPLPNITVEPSGDIGFEWYLANRFSFAIIVGSNNKLFYAGLFGPNRVKGIEFFDDEFPKSITDNLINLYSYKE